jgi:hypothetical protein
MDEDQVDFRQGFFDLTRLQPSAHALVRSFAHGSCGRSLISLGSTRLLATGAEFKVEQPFEGFRLLGDGPRRAVFTTSLASSRMRPPLNGTLDRHA